MTKAVGDFLGTNGIADEMIRFNGFPFLEKDDHAYNVPGTRRSVPCVCSTDSTTVSRVMRLNLKTLPASGLTIQDIGMIIGIPRSIFS